MPRSSTEPSGVVASGEPGPIVHGRHGGATVFLIAILTRLGALAELRDLPLFRTLQLDSSEYHAWALHLLSREFFWPADLPHGPGYPAFLAALLGIFGGSLTAVRIVQSLLGATTCLFVFLIARRTYGEKAGLAAGILCAVYAPLILIDVSILSEGLLIALIVAAVWRALSAGGRVSAGVASGLLLGLGVVVRPTAGVIAPVLFFLLWRDSARPRLIATAFCAALLMPILPVTLMNWQTTGGFIPVQAKGGFNLYQGLSPRLDLIASPRVGGPYEEMATEAARLGLHGPEADRYYLQKLRAEIRATPLRFLRHLARKVFWITQSVEVRDSHSFYFFRADSRVLQATLPFAALFAFGVAGLLAAGLDRRVHWPTLAILLLLACTIVGHGYRHRLPTVPFLAILGGVAIAQCIDLVRTRDLRRLAWLGVAGCCALALSLLRDHPASHNFGEEWMYTGQALVSEGRPREARAAFGFALEEDPRSVRALGGLAAMEVRSGQLDRASILLRRAVEIDDRDPYAHYLSGEVALRQRNASLAAKEYGRAVYFLPDWVEAWVRLGDALTAAGRPAEAGRAFEHVLGLLDEGFAGMPDTERAKIYLRLAEVRASQRRLGPAMAAVRASLALSDQSADGWVLLAALATTGREFELAHSALARARGLVGPRAPKVVVAAAVLEYEQGHLKQATELLDSLSGEPAPSAAVELRRAIAAARTAGRK